MGQTLLTIAQVVGMLNYADSAVCKYGQAVSDCGLLMLVYTVHNMYSSEWLQPVGIQKWCLLLAICSDRSVPNCACNCTYTDAITQCAPSSSS